MTGFDLPIETRLILGEIKVGVTETTSRTEASVLGSQKELYKENELSVQVKIEGKYGT